MVDHSKKALTYAIILIIIGIIFLLTNIEILSLKKTWPILPFLIGVGFFFAYASKRNDPDFLMPGSILVIYSLLFFYCSFSSWDKMMHLWPIFLIAPSVGFYLMFFSAPKNKKVLIPATLLLVLGLLFFVLNNVLSKFWPIILIFIGAGIILWQYLQKDKMIETPVITEEKKEQ